MRKQVKTDKGRDVTTHQRTPVSPYQRMFLLTNVSKQIANIYLDQFDKYVKQYIGQFDKGKGRQQNPPYTHIRGKIVRLNKKIKAEKDESARSQMIKTVKVLKQERNKYPSEVKMDPRFKRMKYARYADDCAPRTTPIVGVDAMMMMEEVPPNLVYRN